MKFSARQVLVVFASFALTLGALFAGSVVYRAAMVKTPLIQYLGQVAGVRSASLSGSTVAVTVKPGANLMTVYQDVTQRATAALGHPPTQVVVRSRPDATLSRLNGNLMFTVAEGESTGQFVAMKNAIETQAHRAGVAAAVQMDTSHVYVTLTQHRHVLYDVIPVKIGGEAHG